MRGDEQESDIRCGAPGTSGHGTAKSSIRSWGVLYKSGAYAQKVIRLTPGDLYGRLTARYGRDIVAPPGNQAANRENKHRPVAPKRLSDEQSALIAMQKSAEGIVPEGYPSGKA